MPAELDLLSLQFKESSAGTVPAFIKNAQCFTDDENSLTAARYGTYSQLTSNGSKLNKCLGNLQILSY